MPPVIKSRKNKTKSNIVKVKNDLIEAFIKSNNLTALKLIFFIAKEGTDIKERDRLGALNITMNTKEICEYCKVDIKTLKRNLEQMQKTSINWKDDEGEGFMSVLPKCEIKYAGKITLTIFQEVLDMISDVSNKYTLVNAEQLMLMNSKHSARMLLLLERIAGYEENIPKYKKADLEELNLLFGTNYKRMSHFEAEVLKKAKDDLDTNSKLSFVYDINYDKEFHTVGRAKAVGVTIHLIDNNPQPRLF